MRAAKEKLAMSKAQRRKSTYSPKVTTEQSSFEGKMLENDIDAEGVELDDAAAVAQVEEENNEALSK